MVNDKCPYCQEEHKTYYPAVQTKAVFKCSSCVGELVIPQLDIGAPALHECGSCGGTVLVSWSTAIGWTNKCTTCEQHSFFSEDTKLQYPLVDPNNPNSGRL